MKKSKVTAIVKKHVAEARASAEQAGAERERRRWERLLPMRGDEHVTWLDRGPPDKLRTVVVLEPTSARFFPVDPVTFYPSREYQRIDFEPIPMALTLATGQQIRWFHWKPRGPYPVSELAVMR